MKGNPWLIGMILLGFACYVMWNNMSLPVIFLGETTQTKALLVDYTIGHGIRGQGYVQIGTLAYEVEDSTLIVRNRLDPKMGKRFVGSHIQLTYSNSNPGKYRIDGYFDDADHFSGESFNRASDGKITEMTVCNGVLGKEVSEPTGKTLSNQYWSYRSIGDTLELFELFDNDNRIVQRFYRQELSENLVYLIDLETGVKYRK